MNLILYIPLVLVSIALSSTVFAFDIYKDIEPRSNKGKTPERQIGKQEMVFIKGGCYQMGDSFGEGGSDEKPVHEVCVDDFYLGKYELTQSEWKEIMGRIPSGFKFCGKDCPVELVSWNDAQEFIRNLNKKTGMKYRLPTEAEWEYAARSGGKKKKWAGTSNKAEFEEYAWYKMNLDDMTINPVGRKKPNKLGLYDMSGNVWEWVSDWYGENYYSNGPRNNPKGPLAGTYRVFRGGSWSNGPGLHRTSYRSYGRPEYMDSSLGARLARTP